MIHIAKEAKNTVWSTSNVSHANYVVIDKKASQLQLLCQLKNTKISTNEDDFLAIKAKIALEICGEEESEKLLVFYSMLRLISQENQFLKTLPLNKQTMLLNSRTPNKSNSPDVRPIKAPTFDVVWVSIAYL